MEPHNKKKYVHFDRETSTNKIFAMLDEIDNDNESDIVNFSKIQILNILRKNQCLKLRKTVTT